MDIYEIHPAPRPVQVEGLRMEQNYEQEYGAVIMDLLMALREKLALIIAVTVLAVAAGFCVSAFLLPQRYEASVNMIVNARTDINAAVTSDDISSAQNLVDTYAIIVKSNTVLNQVINELGLDMRYEDLYENVTVAAINNTQVMKIAARSESPEQARRIVDSITRIAPDIVKDAVEAGSCKVVSQVYVGEDPVSPDIQKNTILAGLLGLVLCVALIVLREIRNDFIVDDVDVGRKLGLPVLGMIPDVEVK